MHPLCEILRAKHGTLNVCGRFATLSSSWCSCHLVGGKTTSEKYELGLIIYDYIFPTEWKVIKLHGSKPPTSQVSTYEAFSEWEISQNPWLKPCVLYGLMYLFNAQKLVRELSATDPT